MSTTTVCSRSLKSRACWAEVKLSPASSFTSHAVLPSRLARSRWLVRKTTLPGPRTVTPSTLSATAIGLPFDTAGCIGSSHSTRAFALSMAPSELIVEIWRT